MDVLLTLLPLSLMLFPPDEIARKPLRDAAPNPSAIEPLPGLGTAVIGRQIRQARRPPTARPADHVAYGDRQTAMPPGADASPRDRQGPWRCKHAPERRASTGNKFVPDRDRP